MTKLCPRGKAAAKRKFKVYPSAYANAYASKICAGKIKDPSGVKRKDFKGPKPAGKAMGGRIYKFKGGPIPKKIIEDSKRRKEGYSYGVKTGKDGQSIKTRIKRGGRPKFGGPKPVQKEKPKQFQKPQKQGPSPRLQRPKMMGTAKPSDPRKFEKPRERVKGYMGGGMTMMPRAMYGKGGGVCKRGMNRQAIGKNS